MPPIQPPFGPPEASLFQIYVTIIPALVASGVIVYAWRMRSSPGALALIAFMIGVLIWSVFGLAFYVTDDSGLRGFWLKTRAAGTSMVPGAWFVLAVQFTGRQRLLTKWVWALIILEFVVYVALNSTNEHHGLVRSTERPSFTPGVPPANPFNYSIVEPLFWVHAAFIYGMVALGTYFLIRFLGQAHGFYRWQIGVALGMLALPATAQFLVLTSTIRTDLTGAAFLLAGAGFAFSIYRFGLLDLVPVARSAIAENMADGVVVLDRNDRIVDINPAAQSVLNLTHSQALGQSVPDMLSPILSGPGESETVVIENANGADTAHFDVRVTELNAGDGTPAGKLVVLRDVSERIRYTQALEETERELRDLDSLKSRFFANISHEFRTPLTLILGPLDSILSRERGGDDQRDLQVMRRNAEGLQNLVDEILDLSRLEAGEFRLHVQRTELVGFLGTLLANFQSLADMHRQTLALVSDLDEVLVYVDRTQMERVFINLVSNALKAVPDGGSVELRIQVADDEKVLVSVRDTGIGIPPEQLPHVFDRFFQTEDSSENRVGSGIGLALAREVMNLHRGDIDVVSEVGVGTTFTVGIRLGSEHFTSDQMAPPDSEHADPVTASVTDPVDITESVPNGNSNMADSSGAGGSLVLLVEDNPDMRAYIRSQLGPSFQLIEAVDGEQGLEQARENVPDLVVSDVMMPVMDGFDLTRELKSDERTSHVPVILLTARADHESRLTGLEFGADDYLAKPFNVRELVTRINNLISLRRQLQRRYSEMVVSIEPETVDLPQMEADFLEKLRAAVEEHISEEEFRVEELASALNISRRQLQRKIRALTGESPGAMLRRIRLEHAARLLSETDINVGEAATAVGFSSPSYFAQVFREQFGQSPTEYVAAIR